MDNIKIEYLPIKELTPYSRNQRKHGEYDVSQIMVSIQKYGFIDPIGVWGDKNLIVEGHGRLAAAKKLHMTDVPVIRLDHLTEEQRKEYALIHNKTAELSEWDFDLLSEDVPTLDFSDFDIDWNLPELDEDEPQEIIEDEAPENVETRCKIGDLWQLGGHRLICGDSTDTAVIDRLMDGVKADMVFTDPPYNMNYCGAGFINEENKNVRERIKDIIDFDPSGISYLATGKIASNVFIFTSKDLIKDYLIMFDGWAFNLLMWHKTNTPPMVNNNYFADTEYLLYFHKGKRIWNNGLKPIDKYKKYFVSAMGQGKKDAGADLHPTMKPVALISNEIEICSNKGGVVLDCFGGSGSTLIACEQLNRKCYMCELDEHYCDVIIQRWENLTGKKAELINGDREE